MNRQEAKLAAPEILSASIAALEEAGFKPKILGGTLIAKKSDRATVWSASFRLLDYEPLWKYEVSFGLNWREIYDYIWIGKVGIPSSEWKKVTIVSEGTPKMGGVYDYSKLDFRVSRDVPRVCNNLLDLFQRVAVPFYERWHDFRTVAPEFWNITPAAQHVTVLPQELSMIGVSAGMILRGDEFAKEIAKRYRDWLRQFDPIAMRKFDEFIDYVDRRYIIKYP